MKRILLLLMFLFQIAAFSQVNDLINCDGNTVFDLTSQESILIGTQNPSDVIITYHTTEIDAQNNTNAISNPSSYTSIVSPEIIFARVENTVTSNVVIENFDLIVNSSIVISDLITSSDCNGIGSISYSIIGGIPPYTSDFILNGNVLATSVSSSNFVSLNNINNGIGTYVISVTDAFGCSTQITTTISSQNPIVANISVNQSLCTNDNATIQVIATGGSGTYQYSISGGTVFQTSNVFSNVPSGTYNIIVQDLDGCFFVSQSITIESVIPIVSNATVNGNTVTLNTTGGTPPYQYSISTNPTEIISNNVFENLALGNYCFYVQDQNGCSVPPICVTVIGQLNLQSTGAYQDFNNDGFVNLGDVINYDFTVTNTSSLDATTISLDSFGLPNNGATIATLTGGATDTSTFTASYILTQQDITNGSVTRDFQVNGTYDGNPTAAFTTNTTTLSISDGIKLNAFLDTNGNNIQDNGEQNINVGSFEYQINNGNTISVVSSTGTYYLYETNPVNTYNLSYTIDSANASLYALSQNNYTNVTVTTNSGITTYNFPLTIIPYVDLQVYLNQNGFPPRPGFTYTERIMYRNLGNQTTSGTITFTKNNVVAITNVSQSGIVSNANGFTYDFTNLLPNETRYISVTMQTPTIPSVALGQVLTNNVTITIPSGDVNVNNNEATLSQVIVGSYDPNDKTEVHGGKILHADFSSEDYLTYTIQFENTGTANAITVKVDDVLDAMLDASTLKMIDASHDYFLKRDGNNLSWNFNGIDLPPSVANTSIGKGYIVFQIKPTAGYAIGDIIPNTANIYFDFNPAIVTNTFTTEFVETLSTKDFTTNDFFVYPNPINDQLFVTSKSNRLIESLNITDVLGKMIYTENINVTSTQLDVSNFQKGIYFLKVKSNEKEEVIKMIKQ
ncbi:T9SS type A sorting domain-containing protein [Flavobacterium jejuense]|uniref:T9SS type A sorting domain-containing protein n=1 Tax=Flavobacterium jejuense TaxID=1544455 RepID=A0ABX0IS94_9FLAO|nr:T9SS type A sorting domain-containing protein [Flavobacterium jejuense]NHN26403.1 T9SS type A sorting domain-containing protein [Flavobacterium jejuense]